MPKIQIIKPAVIVCLGATAAQALLVRTKVPCRTTAWRTVAPRREFTGTRYRPPIRDLARPRRGGTPSRNATFHQGLAGGATIHSGLEIRVHENRAFVAYCAKLSRHDARTCANEGEGCLLNSKRSDEKSIE